MSRRHGFGLDSTGRSAHTGDGNVVTTIEAKSLERDKKHPCDYRLWPGVMIASSGSSTARLLLFPGQPQIDWSEVCR